MNYEILALDLDGTLTNSKKEITPPTVNALIQIQKLGKKVVLASGRPTYGVLPLARQLHLDDYGSYILSFNGGKIINCTSNQTLYNKTLPMGIIEKLVDIIKEFPGIDILSYRDSQILSGVFPNQYSELESRINHMPIIVSKNLAEDIKEPVNKFLVTGDPLIISDVKSKITRYFHSYLNIYYSEPFFLEIMPPGIDKASSLLRLLTSIGLNASQMICCGDGYNDLSMVETAGLGVAMANAQTPVKKSADYITKSNDEDGVLHVVNKFMLTLK